MTAALLEGYEVHSDPVTGALRVLPSLDHFKGYGYAEVPASAVPAATRDAVARWKAYVRIDLKLPTSLAVRWFRPAAGRDPVAFRNEHRLRGLYVLTEGATVWLNANLPALDAVESLAHEGRHVKQWVDYRAGRRAQQPQVDSPADEHDATAYGQETRRFVALPSDQTYAWQARKYGIPEWKLRAWDQADAAWERKQARAVGGRR
jgi:hypothetical protein